MDSTDLTKTPKDIPNMSDIINVDQIQNIIHSDQFNSIFSQVSQSLSNNPSFKDGDIKSVLEPDNISNMVSNCMNTVNTILPNVVDSFGNLGKSSDINVDVDITLNNAYTGIRKKITIKRKSIDPASDTIYIEKKKFVLTILPGVQHEQIITINKEGDVRSNKDSTRGNVNIKIFIEDHDDYTRLNDDDLLVNIKTPIQSLMSDEKSYYKIKALDGDDIMLFVDSSFVVENRLIGCVKNKGMPVQNNDSDISWGDLYVVFTINDSGEVFKTNEDNLDEYLIENTNKLNNKLL